MADKPELSTKLLIKGRATLDLASLAENTEPIRFEVEVIADPLRPPTSEHVAVSWLELMGKASVVVGLVGAWLLLTGWAYAYHYFDHFGLGLSSLGLEMGALPPYGFLTFQTYWSWVVGAFVVLALVVWLLRRAHARLPPTLVISTVSLLLVATFYASEQLAAAMAHSTHRELREQDYRSLRRVTVWVKPDWQEDDALKAQATSLAQGCFRLLFATPKTLFVFRPLRAVPHTPAAMVIARDQVVTYRLWTRALPSCEQ